MKRLLLIGCLFAAFACTKEPAELSGGSGPNPPRIVGTPTSELALKGEISIKLTPEMAQAVAVAQAQLPATRSGAVTRSGVGTIDELLNEIGAGRFERIVAYNPDWEEIYDETGMNRWYSVSFDESVDLGQIGSRFAALSGVAVVEYQINPRYIRPMSVGPAIPASGDNLCKMGGTRAAAAMNDPLLEYQWHYDNPGPNRHFDQPKAGADINLLDAFNSFQLVRELKEATGLPAAASFKHVSPAGAALGLPLDEVDKQIYFVEPDAALSPIACAYIRARGADRLCSYGDWAALSDECDAATAEYLKGEVSDGIIAPSFSEEALVILKTKKGGKYNIVQMDPAYIPAPQEQKDVFGVTFEQGRNNCKIDESLLVNIVTENKNLPDDAKRDMIVSLITLKYTQSNSVCYAKDGQTIGVGAGQQSRIHCTRLAGSKADNWYLRRHPKVLALPFVDGIRRPDRDNAIDVYISDECDDVLADGAWQRVFKERPEPLTVQERKDWVARQSGVTVGSDAFFPFGDNVERARKSGVAYIAEPGGSIRDDNVIETANKYGITMAFTGQRLFHH